MNGRMRKQEGPSWFPANLHNSGEISKTSRNKILMLMLVVVAAVAITVALPLFGIGPRIAVADHGLGAGQSFTFLQPGFTQEIFGVSPHFMGGVAFAPDGDPWVTDCAGFGSELHRYDRQGVAPEINGTKLHPESVVPSDGGCGITNHPNGSLYTNQWGGVVQLDANTGTHLAGPFGPSGNALGIAPDPQTGNLVYVGGDGAIVYVDPTFTTSGTFSTATVGIFVDGIFFDPTGNFLFLATRGPFALTVLDRSGALVQQIPMVSEPDGIAFHAMTPKFVVTNNTDGTLTRFDFPADDFTQPPTQSVFASGGFRGDLSQVGADGCLYLTQFGIRYDDGTESWENNLVRLCSGFSTPPGVGEICGDGIDNDEDGLIDEDCNQPPVCSAATASPASLWPPNHQMASLSILGVTDPDGNPVTITTTSVFQDERVKATGTGSGNTSPDATLSPLAVRAERDGNPKTPGNGRVYHINFTADDGQGGTCNGSVTVCVPHDQRPSGTCVDGGSLYNSTIP